MSIRTADLEQIEEEARPPAVAGSGWMRIDCSPSGPSYGNISCVFIPKGGNKNGIPSSIGEELGVIRRLTAPPDVSFSVADFASLLPLVMKSKENDDTQRDGYAYIVYYKSVQYAYPGCIEMPRLPFGWGGKMEMPDNVSTDDIRRLTDEWAKRKKVVAEKQAVQDVSSSHSVNFS